MGITFVTIASGNIFDFFITSVVVAVCSGLHIRKQQRKGLEEN